VSPIVKATFGSLALRAVAADIRELRTAPHDAALPVLFIREQTRMGDFNPQWDMCSVTDPALQKQGIFPKRISFIKKEGMELINI